MMGYALLRSSWPNARKRYRCIWCGESIPVGLRHRHEISRYDGHFQDHRWHEECDTDAASALMFEEEFTPYGNDRPGAPAGETP